MPSARSADFVGKGAALEQLLESAPAPTRHLAERGLLAPPGQRPVGCRLTDVLGKGEARASAWASSGMLPSLREAGYANAARYPLSATARALHHLGRRLTS
ncbi:hypothetical protein [Streptomyces sp. NBC_01240]|uniref:hypothetical protein n=1 Tax=Streptomyces sp. NBC_01240 TaxID=2903793 RepID=UPI002E12D1C7|nr:hypothetical protein OG466_39050 [Streptomyces sp. NBC_01240]